MSEALLAELAGMVRRQPLASACVLDLIRRGADPNTATSFGESWFSKLLADSDPPVSVAAVNLLIEGGADVNFDAADGLRPLWHACLSQRPELVQCLLDHGADPNFIVDETENMTERDLVGSTEGTGLYPGNETFQGSR